MISILEIEWQIQFYILFYDFIWLSLNIIFDLWREKNQSRFVFSSWRKWEKFVLWTTSYSHNTTRSFQWRPEVKMMQIDKLSKYYIFNRLFNNNKKTFNYINRFLDPISHFSHLIRNGYLSRIWLGNLICVASGKDDFELKILIISECVVFKVISINDMSRFFWLIV